MGTSELKFKNFSGALPPEPPPRLCLGSAGRLTAPPDPQLTWTHLWPFLCTNLRFGPKLPENTPVHSHSTLKIIIKNYNKKNVKQQNHT